MLGCFDHCFFLSLLMGCATMGHAYAKVFALTATTDDYHRLVARRQVANANMYFCGSEEAVVADLQARLKKKCVFDASPV